MADTMPTMELQGVGISTSRKHHSSRRSLTARSSVRPRSAASALPAVSTGSLLSARDAFVQLRNKLTGKFRRINECFRKFDRDGDGRVSAIEFRDSLATMGILVSDAAFRDMWGELDTNGDGFLNFNQFLTNVGSLVNPMATTTWQDNKLHAKHLSADELPPVPRDMATDWLRSGLWQQVMQAIPTIEAQLRKAGFSGKSDGMY